MFVIQRLVVVCNTVGYDDDDYDSLFSFSNDPSNDQRVNVNDVNPENNTGNTARATRKTKSRWVIACSRSYSDDVVLGEAP